MATYNLKYPGAAIDAILDTAYDLQNAGYIFRGLASEYPNTPTERSWVLAGEGETGHGFASPIPKGYIGVCVFNGTSWTGKLLKCVSIDSTPTSGSTNAVSSGGAYASISQLAATVNEALDNLTFTDSTPSAFLGEYIKEKVSTTAGGIERILTFFNILAATAEKAGLLSAADKQKLDAILGNLRSLKIDDTTAYADLGTKIVESIKATIGGQEETISTFQILAATASKAGLLSAADKAKLDALWSSGYQFVGIATPSTTPISTTSKIFYIATEAGTYFNAITVTQGINILLCDGSAWSAVEVVGIDEEPTGESGNLASSGGISSFVKKAANGIVVDYSHMLSVTEGTVSYLASNDYDCLFLTIPSDAVRMSIENAVITGRFYFFGSVDISTESYLTSNSAGIIPVGAKIALCNCIKASNPTYDSSEVSYDCKSDSDRGGLYDEIRYSANNFRILLRKALSKSGDTISIIDSSTQDLLIAYLPPFAGNFSVINAVLDSGYYYFFNSTEASGETYISRNNVGTVPDSAVLCITNISRSDSESDYYKDITTKITPQNIVADNVDYYVREKDYTLIEPDEVLENKRIWNGAISDSSLLDVYVYNNIDTNKIYAFSGKMSGSISSFYYVTYWDENDRFLGYDVYQNVNGVGSEYSNAKLSIPLDAVTIKMNVQKSYRLYYNLNTVVLGKYYDFNQMETSTNVPAPLKVVVNADKSFYVRYSIDDNNDGILVFDYLSSYGLSQNCIMINRYYTGGKGNNDATIMAKTDYQHCADMQSPMFTDNFGPLFSNHGYSTPRVVVENHNLTDGDVGTEWTDQNDYHYTIGRISGNFIYLLPVIYSTGVPGEETRQWKWYSSPYPTQLTRVGTGGETLTVSSHSRWDYQVSQLENVRVIINGKEVDEGSYQCEEVELAYEQIGYNPIFIDTWWPSPVYNDIMLKFDRHFIVSGGKGFLSCTTDTVVNNLYPYPLRHYIDVVPQFPFQIGDYKPYIYIPKMNKVTTDIDFREEFVSVDDSHSAVHYYRNTSDLKDVNDMPDRAYSYLMTDGGDILYGCAGGHSLVRGMSVKTIRNNYIATNEEVGIWNPGAGNKHYNNILQNMGNEGNIVPDTFINEFEGYVCWYKPQNGVHSFYHKSGDSYIVYIHTKESISKGYAVLPDFMNGMGVKETVETTDGIALLTSIVTDGKLFFTSDNLQIEYNYLVVRLS